MKTVLQWQFCISNYKMWPFRSRDFLRIHCDNELHLYPFYSNIFLCENKLQQDICFSWWRRRDLKDSPDVEDLLASLDHEMLQTQMLMYMLMIPLLLKSSSTFRCSTPAGSPAFSTVHEEIIIPHEIFSNFVLKRSLKYCW